MKFGEYPKVGSFDGVAGFKRDVERPHAVAVRGVDVGAGREQAVDAVAIAGTHGPVQRRRAVTAGRVDVDAAGFEQRADGSGVAPLRRLGEQRRRHLVGARRERHLRGGDAGKRRKQQRNTDLRRRAQSSTTPVLSANDVTGTSSFCSTPSSRFAAGVSPGTAMCRPPRTPPPAPATIIGNGA